ncbi:MAG: DUF4203 domain-containing protein [Chloroflexi bacterium]|nr:DUF4203 domain-containing protein [Chloroflexota bacterium]
MAILKILAGAAMLIFGRQLFWLFVGGTGFIVGAEIATRIVRTQNEVMILVIALGVGILGALVAIFLQQFAVAVAGFFAGGLIAVNLLDAFNLDATMILALAFIIGGIVGTALVVALFDWALITLSSIAGASLITRTLDLGGGIAIGAFIALVVIGIAIQAGLLSRKKS